MSFQYLPNEIHHQIFELLPRDTVYQCLLVCKSFWVSAIEIFYRRIYISDNQIPFLNKKLLLLNEEDQNQQFGYGRWTKELKIYESDKPWDTDEYNNDFARFDGDKIPKLGLTQFLDLLSFLPNLKKLHINKSGKHYNYYQGILLCNSVTIGSHLKCIEEISSRDFEFCYNFHETLTCLDIPYYQRNYIMNAQQGDALFFLPHFKHLAYLSIRTIHDTDLTFLEILDTCPNLVSLTFDNRYPVVEHHASTILCNMITKTRTIPMPTSTSPLLVMCKHLKELDLTLPTLIEPYVNFLVHHTSSILNTVKIFMERERFDNWVENTGEDIIMLLFKRISKVANVSITFSGLVSSQAEINTARFFRFLYALRGERNMHCKLDNGTHSDDDQTFYSKLIITNGKYMTFKYPINCDQYSVSVQDNSSSDIITSRQLKEELGIINHWLYGVGSKSGLTVERVLEYALKNCLYLSLISIQHRYYYPFFDAKYFDDRDSNDNGCITTTTTSQNSLTDITMNESMFTPDILDLLYTYLPNIQSIKCLIIDRGYYQTLGSVKLQDNSVDFDLTRLTKLHTFYFDIYFRAAAGEFDYIFVQFKCNNQTDYYKIEKVKDADEDVEQIICTTTTPGFIDRYKETKKSPRSLTITFKCNSTINKLVLCYDYCIIAGFRFGELESAASPSPPTSQRFIPFKRSTSI